MAEKNCRHQRSDMRLRIFKCDIRIEEEASSENEEDDFCDSKIDALKDIKRREDASKNEATAQTRKERTQAEPSGLH